MGSRDRLRKQAIIEGEEESIAQKKRRLNPTPERNTKGTEALIKVISRLARMKGM